MRLGRKRSTLHGLKESLSLMAHPFRSAHSSYFQITFSLSKKKRNCSKLIFRSVIIWVNVPKILSLSGQMYQRYRGVYHQMNIFEIQSLQTSLRKFLKRIHDIYNSSQLKIFTKLQIREASLYGIMITVLSKSFDCIDQLLVIVKLHTCSFEDK